MTITVAVSGASGRLGSLVCDVIEDHASYALVARLGRSSAESEGASATILIDVSHPDASPAIVARALRRGQRVLIGTSGWSQQRLDELGRLIAELRAEGAHPAALVVPNFSLGSVLGTALARLAAVHFDAVEIVETHHAAKVDSPSGTAVRTAEVIAAARDAAGLAALDAPTAAQTARGELVAGVPVHSLRLRGVVAQQEVRFGGTGETLTITHDTQSSDAYRAGIIAALDYLSDTQRGAGLTVGLDRVLGLDAA